MANYFDKYDEKPKANYFDKYDEPEKPKAQQGFNLYNTVDQFTKAANHHLMNALHGSAQLVENVIGATAQKLSDVTGTPKNVVNQYIQQQVAQDNAAMNQLEQQYQAAVPDTPAAYAGAVLGEVLPFVTGGGANILNKVGAKTKDALVSAPKIVQNIGSGAAQGALLGAAQPVTSGNYWDDKSGQIIGGGAGGGAIPAIGTVGGKLLSAVKSPVSSVLDLANPSRIVGRNTAATLAKALQVKSPDLSPAINQTAKPTYKLNTDGTMTLIDGMPNLTAPLSSSTRSISDILAALKNPKEYVQGSKPTTAQALGKLLGSENVPMAQVEKALSNTPSFKDLMTRRDIENNAARLEAISGVAKSPEAIQSAINNRRSITTPIRDSVLTSGKPVSTSPIIEHLDKLYNSNFGTDPVIAKAIKSFRTDIESRSTPDGFIHPDLLDGIRKNVRRTISENSSNGAVSSTQEAGLEPFKNTIINSIESSNPGYRNYLAAYAQHSQPINTMEAGQKIMGGLQGGLDAGGNPALALSKYNSLLAQALKSPYGVAPEAEALLKNVQSDLQRATISNSIKSPGSDTAYNLGANDWLNQQIMGKGLEGRPGNVGAGIVGAGSGALFGPAAGAAAFAGMKGLSGIAANRLKQTWEDAMMNPEVMAQILAKYGQPAQQQTPSALADAIRNLPIINSMK